MGAEMQTRRISDAVVPLCPATKASFSSLRLMAARRLIDPITSCIIM